MTSEHDTLLGRSTQPIRSRIDSILWPAIPSERAATLLALSDQLDESQWWSPERLLAHQLAQAKLLVQHACANVPYYDQRLRAIDLRGRTILDFDAFRALPLLTRRDVQDAGAQLHARYLDSRFGGTFELHTSGSTGEPVKLLASELDRVVWEALTLRDHEWHRRDFSRRLASIRANIGVTADDTLPDWGTPTSEVFMTGPAFTISSNSDYAVQVDWLRRHRPEYLVTYPSNLGGLLDHCEAHDITLPGLQQVRTTGETLSDEIRRRCLMQFGVAVVDLYSSQESGYLALQCPQSGLYHVMSEAVLLEVLGPDGMPCDEGETGEVVVTSLHNFATPLIRYRVGDHAEVGPRCHCGRGLPTLRRIRGRSRHLVRLPDGTRHWPMVGFTESRDIAPIRQYQAIQRDLAHVELRLVADRQLTASEERQLRAVVQKWIGHPFDVRFVYFENRLPVPPSGKFEDFICLLD